MQTITNQILEQLSTIVLGKERQVKLALACLLAKGHLLIEDLPGMGKTTLSLALAKALGLSFNRIQFTSDLLPADILGVSIFKQSESCFEFHPGPIFSHVVLADEINRATPKTQSALLEAMAENQVTVEGETRPLLHPFFVIATQNPITQGGTYPLPESQLDRFSMCISLGYPHPEAERELLKGNDPRIKIEHIEPCIEPCQLIPIQEQVLSVSASETLLDYVQRLIAYSRETAEFAYGLSPRAAIALMQCSQAWAFIEGRNYVLPEDVQAVLPSVVEHRLREASDYAGHGGGALADRMLSNVNVVA